MNFDPVITLSGVASIASIIGVGLAVLGQGRKNRRDNEADARASEERIKDAHRADSDRIETASRERSDEIKSQLSDIRVTLGERVAKVEATIGDYVPRRELDGRFEHDKNGSLARDKALETRIDRNSDDIRAILVDVGGLKQRQDGFGLSLARIEELIRENNRETSAKLDKMSDQIGAGRPRS